MSLFRRVLVVEFQYMAPNKFLCLTSSNMKMIFFWDTAPCSLVQVNRRFTSDTFHNDIFRHFLLFSMVLVFALGVCSPRPTPKLEDHPLSADRDSLFIYSQLSSISGGHLFCRKPQDTPFPGDKGHVTRKTLE
jgi:hypothetical protein